jgi:phytoene dehydrogenase-like protein
MEQNWDVVVVGAGLAGLTAAATAAAAGATTLVVDAHQPGGRASTDERGRYRFNRGGHALYRGGAGEAVLARLGVTVEGVDPPAKGARGRLGDRVGVLPADGRSLFRSNLLRPRSKVAVARMLSGVKRWRPGEVAGLTIGEWLDGFDLADDARAFARMLVRTTTYLHDEHTVSADVAAAQITQALTHGVQYLHGGWSSLVEALACTAWDNGAQVRPHAAAKGVAASKGGFTVHGSGVEAEARAVVVAAGTPPASAALLEEQARPLAWAGLGPEVEAACLDLGLTRALPQPILLGIDRPLYLIDHAATARGLAPDGGGLVHVLRYLGLGEEITVEAVRAELEDHARAAGIEAGTIEEQRFLRRMTVAGASPTPAGGGLAGRPTVDSTGCEGLYVAGDWVGPTGWLADAAFASGEAAGAAAASRAMALAGRRPARQDVA